MMPSFLLPSENNELKFRRKDNFFHNALLIEIRTLKDTSARNESRKVRSSEIKLLASFDKFWRLRFATSHDFLLLLNDRIK